MALRRRGQDHFSMGIWPGFVDAMTAMLLVFTFVLSIFMITQYFLRETIVGQEEQILNKDEALISLTSRLNSLSDMLSLEQDSRAEVEQREEALQRSFATLQTEKQTTEQRLQALAENLQATETQLSAEREATLRQLAERRAMEALAESLRNDLVATEKALVETSEALGAEESERVLQAAAADALRKKLAGAEVEFTAMELQLEERRVQAEETLILLAAAREAEADLKGDLGLRDEELSKRELALSLAREKLSSLSESSAEEQKQIALLNEQTRALRTQLMALNEQLEGVQAERSTLEADAERTSDVISSLGARLNTALAERNRALAEKQALLEEQVDELSNFRSEFFGRVKEAIAGRNDIQIVGDRFIFQSEVLFEPASADLNEAGKADLAAFAGILRQISADIPRDLNWILRIDGHTDRRGLAPGRTRFRNNWELSQARALSVAEFLIDTQEIAPNRLAPTGFGEFQPVRSGNSAEDYARNRRIELKLTER